MRVLPLLLLALGACAAMRMTVPGPLASTPEWTVERSGWRGDRMRFGPYEVHDIEERNRQRGGILDALSGKREMQQSYDFLLRDTTAAEDLWRVRCDHRDVDRSVSVRGVRIGLEDRTSLECTLQPPADPSDPWTLRLGSSGERMPAGELRHPADSAGYRVRAQTPSGTGCCEVAGFVVSREDRPLLSLDRADRGRIRISPELTAAERHLLAAAAAALLLRDDLLGRS